MSPCQAFASLRMMAVLAIAGTAVAGAQRQPGQPVPAPRPLGPIVGRSAQTFANVGGLLTVRGGVFVQDVGSRQLWMLDPSLASGRVVLDSTSGLGKEDYYGPQSFATGLASGTIHRFRGDSITYQAWILTGPTEAQLSPEGLIIGPSGRMGRIVTMPTAAGCPLTEVENSGFYTCQLNRPLTYGSNIDMGDSVMSRGRADSAMFLSVDFRTWDVDTIPGLRITTMPRTQVGFTYKNRSGARAATEAPVLALADAWATFRDGTLVIARAADYHLDIVDVRGNVTNGPRAPFAWRRVTDDDRDRLLDSLRRADSVAQRRRDSIAAVAPRRVAADGTVLPLLRGRASQAHAPPDEWSTIWPPFKATTGRRQAVVLVDEDDRIWVDERQPPGEDSITVYGIFDKKGQFLDRVKIPAGQQVAAFGPGGAVYLTTVDGGRTTVLKARFR